MDDVKLRFGEDALREVVGCALRRKTGARGLRSLLEEVCHDLMFDAPERRGETIVIDGAFVRERLGALAEVDLATG
jgi:ATP-dependent protease Clp ATPase subunit